MARYGTFEIKWSDMIKFNIFCMDLRLIQKNIWRQSNSFSVRSRNRYQQKCDRWDHIITEHIISYHVMFFHIIIPHAYGGLENKTRRHSFELQETELERCEVMKKSFLQWRLLDCAFSRMDSPLKLVQIIAYGFSML